MSLPTARQQQVLDFIQSHVDNDGYPPTIREICAHLGVSGTVSAMRHLDALEKKGYIKRDSGSRGIAITSPTSLSASLPIVGTVRAGDLSPAVEDITGYLSVDRILLHGGKFFLRVQGDSMINASICGGDLVLVRPQASADNREIVVAMVDGEATLKRFFRENATIRLQPENPKMAAIVIPEGSGDVTIIGKVVGLYRDLG
ncbi:MAG: transcriptional repressor LexA [Desulfuromonadaceae bacterium]|nr:transcriptional repressor LexA [Desulfuromonadaceae bacterium]